MKDKCKIPNMRMAESCSTCKYGFSSWSYDDIGFMYCTREAEPRPKCGSIAQREHIREMEAYAKWETWSAQNEVEFNCVCDKYEKGESDNG